MSVLADLKKGPSLKRCFRMPFCCSVGLRKPLSRGSAGLCGSPGLLFPGYAAGEADEKVHAIHPPGCAGLLACGIHLSRCLLAEVGVQDVAGKKASSESAAQDRPARPVSARVVPKFRNLHFPGFGDKARQPPMQQGSRPRLLGKPPDADTLPHEQAVRFRTCQIATPTGQDEQPPHQPPEMWASVLRASTEAFGGESEDGVL